MPQSAGSGGGYTGFTTLGSTKKTTNPYATLAARPSGPAGTFGSSLSVAPTFKPPAPPKPPVPPAAQPQTAASATNPAAAAAAQAPAATPANPYAGIDYSADPVLASVRLLGQQAIPDAIAQADAARKQLLIGYGDPALARAAIFGGQGFNLPGIAGGPAITIPDTSHTGDEATALAAQQNPFSTLAQLAHAHTLQDQSIDETLNDKGLFYSSTHVQELQNEAYNYLQQKADAYSKVAAALGTIDQNLGQAYQTEAQNELAAEEAAFARAIQLAGTNPAAIPSGGSSSGGGTGGGGAGGYTVAQQPAGRVLYTQLAGTPAQGGVSPVYVATPTSPTTGYTANTVSLAAGVPQSAAIVNALAAPRTAAPRNNPVVVRTPRFGRV